MTDLLIQVVTDVKKPSRDGFFVEPCPALKKIDAGINRLRLIHAQDRAASTGVYKPP
ncbi:hypothetical protein ACFS07_04720 [Undibacterium arcticum]